MLNGISRPIYIATEPVDMRKSFDGLAAIVKNHFHGNPLSGHLFVFINRTADRIKVLYWDNDGYALWYKKLEAEGIPIFVFTKVGRRDYNRHGGLAEAGCLVGIACSSRPFTF